MTEAEWTQVLARAAWGDRPLPHWIEPPTAEMGLQSETEWLACDDPRTALLTLQGKVSQRKLRLFAVTCCRDIWPLLPGQDCRDKVELAEQYADDQVAFEKLTDPYETGYPIGKGLSVDEWKKGYASFACWHAAAKDAWEAATHAFSNATNARCHPDRSHDERSQLHLLRDIFGNPFRPVPVDPTWLTPTVVSLAEGIYADRAFDRMPILADALQDAGCDNDEVLNHCRQPSEHVRGCWVVDLLLGKG